MALHKKVEPLMSLEADVAVIQECAEFTNISANRQGIPCTDIQWIGHQKNKGLGVFSFGDFKIQKHESFSSNFHLFMPIIVAGPVNFNLMAVWAYNHRVPNTYPNGSGGPFDAFSYYHSFLSAESTIVIGDFNNNYIWDKPGNPYNHSRTVESLDKLGLRSAYHSWCNETFGSEQQASFYFYRHPDKPYHIDYAFLSAQQIQHLSFLELGNATEWLEFSDHVPLVVDLDFGSRHVI
jgi:hypothetical protein